MHNNTPHNLKDSILGKIESEHITPTPQWRFAIQHGLLWIPGTLVTLVGACAWAGMLFGWQQASFIEYQRFIAPSRLQFLLQTMPLIWIGSFLLFTGVIVQTLRLTPKGYRLDSRKIIGGSLLISIIVGTLLYMIDMRGYRNPIMRYPVERQHKAIWSHPETGHLAGLVEIQDDVVILTDLNNKQWALDTSFLPTTTTLTNGAMSRFVGKQIDDENFLICVVLPWNLSPGSRRPAPGRIPKMMLFSTSTDPRPCDKLILMSQS